MHLVDGTFRKDRHDGDYCEPSGVAPKPPPFLNRTAKREWARVVPALERLGILDEVDQSALAVYCQARADYSWAVYRLRREGRVIVGPSGLARTHPAMRVQKEAAEQIRKFAVEFGLTPSARGRLAVPQRDDDDPEENEWFKT